jgi:hypothetical protein
MQRTVNATTSWVCKVSLALAAAVVLQNAAGAQQSDSTISAGNHEGFRDRVKSIAMTLVGATKKTKRNVSGRVPSSAPDSGTAPLYGNAYYPFDDSYIFSAGGG